MDSKLLLANAPHAGQMSSARGETGPGRELDDLYEGVTILAPETRPVVTQNEQANVEVHDMGKFSFFSNSLLADLIRLVRNALKQGKELRFINVPEGLKNAIRKMGLSEIIKCG